MLKTYKFEDGQWNYTYNFCNGKIRDVNTLLAVEYYYLPNINAAFSSGSLGGYFHDDVYDVEYSYGGEVEVGETTVSSPGGGDYHSDHFYYVFNAENEGYYMLSFSGEYGTR